MTHAYGPFEEDTWSKLQVTLAPLFLALPFDNARALECMPSFVAIEQSRIGFGLPSFTIISDLRANDSSSIATQQRDSSSCGVPEEAPVPDGVVD